jgi:type VII secretion-associated serine protease mycosin
MAALDRRWQLLVAVAAAALFTVAAPSPAWADSIRDKQWHLDFLKAGEVRKITKGKGVTVGIVDTGVDGRQPDLTGNVLRGKDFIPPLDANGWDDTDGHGTAMAALIAGHGHGPGRRDGALGLAPEARVLPAVTSLGEWGSGASTAKAIRWAVDHGAKVINLSLHGEGLDGAVNYALVHDVVVIAAAGNTADGYDTVVEPASLPGVVAVSGVGKDGKFSSTSAQGGDVALAAPAVHIMSAGSGKRGKYRSATGTSDATALVSAAAALVRARYPDLNAASVIERLIATADDKGPEGRDNQYGFGVVDPLKALTATDVPKAKKNPLGGPIAKPAYTGAKPAGSAIPARAGVSAALIIGGATVGGLAILVVLAGVLLVHRKRRRSPTHASWPPSPPDTLPPTPSPPREPPGSHSGPVG